MSTDKRYDVILMDADGTLLDFDRSEAEAFGRVLVRFGFSPEESLIREYHEINKVCWEAFEEGRMEKKDVLTKRFELFFRRHDTEIDGDQVEELYREYLEQGAYLIEGALSICGYLKERYTLYIVTNGVAATQYRRLRASGLSSFFRDVFVSEEAGSQKPQKEFFDYCFKKIPAPNPERMLLIGDSLTSDMLGGVNAGVDTCWFNPRKEKNKKKIPVTYEIFSLHDILDILR